MFTHSVIPFVLLLPASANAEQYTAKVVRVVDGDSLRVLHNGNEVDIRVEGID